MAGRKFGKREGVKEVPKGPPRAVGYVRVSSKRQAKEGASLEAQRDWITAYAQGKGWELVKMYRDEGESAWDPEATRDGYDKMMASIESWDILIAYKLDRLWRQADMAIGTHKRMKDAGKQLVLLSDSIDTTTAGGQLMFGVMSLMADFFSAQLSERVLASKAHAFETRDTWQTRPPLGYDIGNKRLIVNEGEAKIVRRLFCLADEGKTLSQIIAAIEDVKGKNGKGFHPASLWHVLRNPVYAGYSYLDRTQILKRNGHDAIIEDATWNRVQVRLLLRSKGGTNQPVLVGEPRIEAIKSSGRKQRGASMYIAKNPRPLAELLALVAS